MTHVVGENPCTLFGQFFQSSCLSLVAALVTIEELSNYGGVQSEPHFPSGEALDYLVTEQVGLENGNMA